MAQTGLTPTNRVDTTTERVLASKVTLNILDTPTLASRTIARGRKMEGKTQDFTVKVTQTSQGEFFSGMPTLNSSATDTTITLSYAHNLYSHPIVIPFDDALANEGKAQTIPLTAFKTEEAHIETMDDLGAAFYGTGSGDQPMGLGGLVDDGTSVSSIGGQSRTTYSALNATRTASGGKLTLTKLATLWSNITNGSMGNELPTAHFTTPTVFDLYESLLQPSVRQNISINGYGFVPITGDKMLNQAKMLGAAGFQVLTYRGVPVMSDSYCTSGYWYTLNERYLQWYGRDEVPARMSGKIQRVNLGEAKTVEGQEMMPSKYHGFFFQDFMMHPDQPGMIARLYVAGQFTGRNFRRSGVLTGIMGV